MNMAKKGKKFKAVEKNNGDAPTKDANIEWEGEELMTESNTKLEQDTGTGQAIVLRFFDFGADPEVFKQHKPTAQELFNTHMRGLESLLWRDGLRPFQEVEPRLMFSKNKSHYRFILACIPVSGRLSVETPRTLTQLLHKT